MNRSRTSPYVIITFFGVPVVPDEKTMRQGAFQSCGASSNGGRSLADCMNQPVSTATLRSPSMGAPSVTATRDFAYSCDSGRGETDTDTAPIRDSARSTSQCRYASSTVTDTRTPGSIDAATRRCVTRSMCSAKPRYVTFLLPAVTASACGLSRAWNMIQEAKDET